MHGSGSSTGTTHAVQRCLFLHRIPSSSGYGSTPAAHSDNSVVQNALNNCAMVQRSFLGGKIADLHWDVLKDTPFRVCCRNYSVHSFLSIEAVLGGGDKTFSTPPNLEALRKLRRTY